MGMYAQAYAAGVAGGGDADGGRGGISQRSPAAQPACQGSVDTPQHPPQECVEYGQAGRRAARLHARPQLLRALELVYAVVPGSAHQLLIVPVSAAHASTGPCRMRRQRQQAPTVLLYASNCGKRALAGQGMTGIAASRSLMFHPPMQRTQLPCAPHAPAIAAAAAPPVNASSPSTSIMLLLQEEVSLPEGTMPPLWMGGGRRG